MDESDAFTWPKVSTAPVLEYILSEPSASGPPSVPSRVAMPSAWRSSSEPTQPDRSLLLHNTANGTDERSPSPASCAAWYGADARRVRAARPAMPRGALAATTAPGLDAAQGGRVPPRGMNPHTKPLGSHAEKTDRQTDRHRDRRTKHKEDTPEASPKPARR